MFEWKPFLKRPVMKELDASKIQETVDLLVIRIGSRFEDRGIFEVARELQEICSHSNELSEWISKPIYSLRAIIWISTFLFITGISWLLFKILETVQLGNWQLVDIITAIEAGSNELILFGALIYFLFSIEQRVKRHRALTAIHELRSIAHIIDMHQLTKDPERLREGFQFNESSPSLNLTAFELERYLDYCSEMLSITGKIAALYLQKFEDETLLNAVTEIENLTQNLSGKIWQKILIIDKRVYGDSPRS